MIYPVPQKNNLNGLSIDINAVTVSGSCMQIAESILADYGIDITGGFSVEIRIENSRKTTYVESLSRLSNEKYFITVTQEGVLIEASSKRGVFRAVNTLAKLIVKNELKTGMLEDYPMFEKRGYIEGFYGKTWAKDKRLSVMKLMSCYGMNTFYYAPKDDLYHRAKWSESYPEKELSELKMLADAARDNELDFCWCVGPGLTYRYTSESDFQALISKIMNVYSIGVRAFGLLLDDIPDNFQYDEDAATFYDTVDAHIYLINRTYLKLKEIDPAISLTVCPTQYFGDTQDYYITKFGNGIPRDVEIFWTGREICSTFLTCREADDFQRSTSHRPLYWDNYPVNDAEMFQEMHLGAVKGRDKDLYKHCQGLISNVMEYAECSKIPLMTIADYLWNPVCYDSEKSLENAQKEVLDEKSELFKYIADHLCVACVSRHGSMIMSEKLSHLSFLMTTGEKEKALELFADYIKVNRECLDMVRDVSVPLFAEIGKWVRKFSMCCDVLDAIYAVWKSPDETGKLKLGRLIDEYNADAVILTGFCLRETAEKTLEMT